MNAHNLMPHSQTPSPAAHPVHCAGSPEPSSALPPQRGAQVPSSLQGATGSTTRLVAAPQPQGKGSATLTAIPALASARPGSSYSALGAGFGPGERGSGGAGGRSPELPRARPRRSGLAAPRQALRRVQLHRLPPPHLALLPVSVGLQPLQHGQALRQALGGREQDVVVEEGGQDGADQGSDPEDLGASERAARGSAPLRSAPLPLPVERGPHAVNVIKRVSM